MVSSIDTVNNVTITGNTFKDVDVAGTAAEGKLSVTIHSSINGTVTEVNDRYVIVTRRKELD